MTADYEKKLVRHKIIADSVDVDFFFARPDAFWARATNENMNGMLRQYFQKNSDFRTVTDEEVQQVIDKLNSQPRKCLGCRARNDVFFSKSPISLAS